MYVANNKQHKQPNSTQAIYRKSSVNRNQPKSKPKPTLKANKLKKDQIKTLVPNNSKLSSKSTNQNYKSNI